MKRVTLYIFLIILLFTTTFVFSLFLYSSFFNNPPNIDKRSTLEESEIKTSILELEKQNSPNDLPPEENTVSKNYPTINLAIFGIDQRDNEKSRSDVLMIIKYIPKEKSVLLVSIPRDSKVKIPGKGENKINAAHAFGGAELQRKTLEELFNIKIDYYIRINFKGFIEIIDSVGGVEINSQKIFLKDSDDDTLYIKEGINNLDGKTALEYVRFRKDKDGDFGRIRRQQEIIISLSRKLLSPKNIVKLPKVINILRKNVSSDINWFKAVPIVLDIKDMDSITIEEYTLETKSKKINGIWYELIDENHLKELSKKLQN